MQPQIKIKIADDTITIDAPYSATNNDIYRQKNGKYARNIGWQFPDCRPVRKMLFELFGWQEGCGVKEVELTTEDVQHEYVESRDGNTAELLYKGYVIATRQGRDYKAQIPDGVIIDEGGFPDSGGSVKHPSVVPLTGTTFVVAIYDGWDKNEGADK